MNILPSMESIEDVQKKLATKPGLTDQPVVPVFLPEEDDMVDLYNALPLSDVNSYPVKWNTDITSAMESAKILGGSQEVLQSTKNGKLKLDKVYQSSKAVYVATPKTQAELLQSLDKDKILGIYVNGELSDFTGEALEALVEVGLDKVCTSMEALSNRLCLNR